MTTFNRSLKLVALCCLIAVGCDSADSRHAGPVPTAKATPLETTAVGQASSSKSQEPSEKLIGGVKFEIPGDWEEKVSASTVLLAEFSLPGATGAGRLTLSTAGGGVTLNMDRWKGQFQRGANDPESKESQIIAAGKDATMIEVYGTYSDMFGGTGPKANWQLLGVAIPISGQQQYFVKLTGPRETVSARRDEFLKFIKSARFEE